MRLINGYQVSQAIHVAATLGIADELADGPRTVGDLASVTATHAGALHRLLRALAAVEVVREEDDGRFGLTDFGGGAARAGGVVGGVYRPAVALDFVGASAAQRADRRERVSRG